MRPAAAASGGVLQTSGASAKSWDLGLSGWLARNGNDKKPKVSKQVNQTEVFDSAMKHFHARDFAAARKLFEQAAEGPSREMAHTARLHARMCEQRLAQSRPEIRNPEELYLYSIGLINRRQLPEAENALRRALEQAPQADHVHYAMALVRGLQGNLEEASRFLARAIEINPQNRIIARNDPDFLEFGRQAPLKEMVFSDAPLSAKKET
jgi:Tfp pilus assembly protein PilF